MKLPDEVLRIVRAYAKPRLRYPRTYKEVLRVLGMKRWPELMEKLSGQPGDPNHALSVVKTFLSVEDSCHRANLVYLQNPTEETKMMRDLVFKIKRPAYESLVIMIYGKKPDYMQW